MPFPEDNIPVQFIAVGDAAGGALTGTYPNPDIKKGYITTDYLGNLSVSTDKIQDASVTASKLADIDSLGIFPIISGSQIYSGILTNSHIATGANIETIKLAEGPLFLNNYQNQVVSGIKAFEYLRLYGNPTLWFDAVNKGFLETSVMSGTPIVQVNGTTIGQRKTINFVNSGNLLLVGQLNTAQNRIDIIISGGAGGGGVTSGAPTDVSYLVLSTDSRLSAERAFAVDTAVFNAVDGGANGNYTLNLRNAAISGNYIAANSIQQGHVLSGYVDLFTNQVVSGNKIFNSIQRSGYPILPMDLVPKAYVDNNLNSGIAHPITVFNNGNKVLETKELNFLNYPSIFLVTTPNGSNRVDITLSGIPQSYIDNSLNSGLSGRAPITSNFVTVGNDAGLPNERALAVGSIFTLTDGGANSNVAIDLKWGAISGNNIASQGISQGSVLNGYVDLITAQVISGNKLFNDIQRSGNPTLPLDLVNKGYVDNNINSGIAGLYNQNYVNLNTLNSGIAHPVTVFNNSNKVAEVKELNFIPLTNIYITTIPSNNGNRVDISISGTSGGGGPPTGAAGGDLSGTYPNPSIALGVISGNKIAANSILQGHVANGYVDLITAQIISGNKVFNDIQRSGYPTLPMDLVPKAYVDNVLNSGLGAFDVTYSGHCLGNNRILISNSTTGYTESSLRFSGGAIEETAYSDVVLKAGPPDPTGDGTGMRGQLQGSNAIVGSNANGGDVDLLPGDGDGAGLTGIITLRGKAQLFDDLTTYDDNDVRVIAGVDDAGTGGHKVTIAGTNAKTGSNASGGNVDLLPGDKDGIGNPGIVNIKNAAEFTDGVNVPISSLAKGRLRYNDTTKKFEQSINSGSWLALSTQLYVDNNLNSGIAHPITVFNNSNKVGEIKELNFIPNTGVHIVTDLINPNRVNVTFSGSNTGGSFVDLTTAQTISGNKLFNDIQRSGNPTLPLDLVNKSYVDNNINSGLAGITAGSQTYTSNGLVDNIGFNVTYSGNKALLLTLTQANGSDFSTGTSAGRVSFRDSANTGRFNVRTISSPLTLTIASGSSLGVETGIKYRLYAGLLDVSGTPELCVWNPYHQFGKSLKRFDENSLQTSTALATSSNTPQIIYSTTARPTVPFRYIGVVELTNSTGAWAGTINKNYPLSAGSTKTGDKVGYIFSGVSSLSNTTSIIPYDSTIPQITEGSTWVSAAYKAQSECNILKIKTLGYFATGLFSPTVQTATFSGNNANSLSAGVAYPGGTNSYNINLITEYIDRANNTNNINYSCRFGTDAGNSVYLNGRTNGAIMFGNINSYLKIEEIFA